MRHSRSSDHRIIGSQEIEKKHYMDVTWQSLPFDMNNVHSRLFPPHMDGPVHGHCLNFTFHMILVSLYKLF